VGNAWKENYLDSGALAKRGEVMRHKSGYNAVAISVGAGASTGAREDWGFLSESGRARIRNRGGGGWGGGGGG